MADEQPKSVAEFAAAIKTKYPEYKDAPDDKLARAMVAKYPEYRGRVQFGPIVPTEQQAAAKPPIAPTNLVKPQTMEPSPMREGLSSAMGNIPGVKQLEGFEQRHPQFGPSMGIAAGAGVGAPEVGDILPREIAAPVIKSAAKGWQALNEAIGTKAANIRVGKGAATVEEAATMPGRALEKEGFTAAQLKKMTPLEQGAAITPKWNAAGRAVDHAVADATVKGVTFSPAQSQLAVIKKINNPQLQQQAVQQLSRLMEDLGISDASSLSPQQGLHLRRALQPGARFGPNGDLNTLGSIRASLYRAVTQELQSAVPGLQKLDQHYSDLNEAVKATQKAAKAYLASGKPPSKLAQAAKAAAPYVAGAAGTAGAYGVGRKLLDIWKAIP